MTDVPVRLAGALLALAIATVHVADQGGITVLNSPAWMGWSFRLVEVGGVLTALILLVPALLPGSALRPWPGQLGWAAAALLGAGPFASYITSRSVGLPGDSGDIGNWGYWVGTISLFVESALVILSVSMLLALRQASRSATAAAVPVPVPSWTGQVTSREPGS